MPIKKQNWDPTKNSFILKLKRENKINDTFLSTVSLLSLEDLIAIKLEQTVRDLKGKWHGFPIKKVGNLIVKEALVKVAEAFFRTQTEQASFLGMDNLQYYHFKEKINHLHDIKKTSSTTG